jgi:hypothetical protein
MVETVVLIWVSNKVQNPNHPCSEMPKLYSMNKYQADCLSGCDITVSGVGTKAYTATSQQTPPPPPQSQNSHRNKCMWKSLWFIQQT